MGKGVQRGAKILGYGKLVLDAAIYAEAWNFCSTGKY
jgi:hypothetical protein